jgi:pimeloyl-ACP methyl ester carboxylesterase
MSAAMSLFKLRNAKGRVVKGVIVRPATPAVRPLGFVWVSGIVLGCAAVHRIGFAVAREVARAGHFACLFDPSGVGESEGDYPSGTNRELTAWVESGSLVDDTLEAARFLERATGASSLALVGHCGGALTSMYAGANNPRVRGVMLLSPPPVPTVLRRDVDHGGRASEYMRLYLAKLKSCDGWKRLLSGRSSYRTMASVLRRALEDRVVKRTAKPQPRAFNERLVGAMHEATERGKHVRIVFGDRDPDVSDFRALQETALPRGVAWRILPDTSHGFVTGESMDLLFSELGAFLRTCAAT